MQDHEGENWLRVERPPAPVGGTVVIRARLSGLPSDPSALSADERARAARLVLEPRRRDFVAGRAFLRRVLAAWLDEPPEALRFRYGPLGKPALEGGGPVFNLAHSGELLLLSLAADGDLGIDLEVLREDRDLVALAARFFAPEERAALAELESGARSRAFHEIWTRKEAVLKTLGSGVFEGLDRFVVTAGPGPRLLRRPEGEPGWEGLGLIDLGLPGAAAALCRRGGPSDLTLLEDPSWETGSGSV